MLNFGLGKVGVGGRQVRQGHGSLWQVGGVQRIQGAGQDPTTKQRWYKLAVQAIQEQNSPTAKPKMQTVTVKVYFAGNERNLPTRPGYYTVAGMGEIMVDGSLQIRNARTVSVSPKKPEATR